MESLISIVWPEKFSEQCSVAGWGSMWSQRVGCDWACICTTILYNLCINNHGMWRVDYIIILSISTTWRVLSSTLMLFKGHLYIRVWKQYKWRTRGGSGFITVGSWNKQWKQVRMIHKHVRMIRVGHMSTNSCLT